MSSFSAYTFQRGKGQLASAWLNFDGRGSGATRAIRESFNINSVTDLGVGLYRVTFTAPMPNNYYSVVASCSLHIGSDGTSLVSDVATATIRAMTVDYFELTVASHHPTTVSKFDPEFVTVAVFGD